jgi:hypothetical protein
MKLTNVHGLPETIMLALHRPTYTKEGANMSVTELLGSPRIVQLKRRHWDELEQDASEMVWSLFGTAIHHILEHGKAENHVIEQRLHAKVDGWHISGAIDLQVVTPEGIEISDYKTTSAYKVMAGSMDWEEQLNIYAYLVESQKKVPVTKIQIVAIVRDWSAREAAYKEGYPKAPIVVLDIPLWPFENREQFIRDRITAHSDATFAQETDEELPECTPKDMWERPTSYAIMKDGGVRAKSVHASKEEAEKAWAEIKDYTKYKIIERPGERVRCAGYCQVSKFCSQYQQFLNQSKE